MNTKEMPTKLQRESEGKFRKEFSGRKIRLAASFAHHYDILCSEVFASRRGYMFRAHLYEKSVAEFFTIKNY